MTYQKVVPIELGIICELWYLELKMGPSGSVQLLHMEKPTTPNLHLYVIICDSGVKTI